MGAKGDLARGSDGGHRGRLCGAQPRAGGAQHLSRLHPQGLRRRGGVPVQQQVRCTPVRARRLTVGPRQLLTLRLSEGRARACRDNLRAFFDLCFPTLLRRVFGYDYEQSWLNVVAKVCAHSGPLHLSACGHALAASLPSGRCMRDLRRWAGRPTRRPSAPSSPHLVRALDQQCLLREAGMRDGKLLAAAAAVGGPSCPKHVPRGTPLNAPCKRARLHRRGFRSAAAGTRRHCAALPACALCALMDSRTPCPHGARRPPVCLHRQRGHRPTDPVHLPLGAPTRAHTGDAASSTHQRPAWAAMPRHFSVHSGGAAAPAVALAAVAAPAAPRPTSSAACDRTTGSAASLTIHNAWRNARACCVRAVCVCVRRSCSRARRGGLSWSAGRSTEDACRWTPPAART